MTKRLRFATAGIAVVISVPAIVSCYLGIVLTFLFARLGGYNGTPTDALFNILRLAAQSPAVAGAAAAVVCAILYWCFFTYAIVMFARGQKISRFVQLFCMVVVLLVIAERICLELQDEKVPLWFGVLSVPHAIALFSIFMLQKMPTDGPSASVDLRSTKAIAQPHPSGQD
jgi:hypothetical protein